MKTFLRRLFLLLLCFLKTYGTELDYLSLSSVVEATLCCQWDIKLAIEEAQRFQGIAQLESGSFDTTVGSSLTYTWQNDVQITGFKTHEDGNILFQDLSLSKLYRIGTAVSLVASVEREKNPAQLFDRTNDFVLQFLIDQPLLRRFMYNPEVMNEKSACLNWRAAKYDAIHEISSQLRLAVNAYWDLNASEQFLKIREESQKRLQDIADSTEKLVEGGQMAASELNQQYAEIAREQRRRTEAEQAVYAAYNQLLLQMGIVQPFQTLKSPYLLLEQFPEVEEKPPEIPISSLEDYAVTHRNDLLASTLRIGSADYLVKSAKNAVLPELNLVMGTNVLNNTVNQRAKPFYSSVTSRLPEQDYLVGVQFSKPLCNDAAKGDLRRRRAEKLQASLVKKELEETVRSDVATALRNHYSLVNEMAHAKESVRWWKQALDDELKRLIEGLSTLFVVLDFQTRLSNAQEEEVFVHTRYAQNIVNLMFLTGALVVPCDQNGRVVVANFRNMEFLENL